MLTIACPKCQANVKIDESHVGKRGRCNKCGEVFTVLSAESAYNPFGEVQNVNLIVQVDPRAPAPAMEKAIFSTAASETPLSISPSPHSLAPPTPPMFNPFSMDEPGDNDVDDVSVEPDLGNMSFISGKTNSPPPPLPTPTTHEGMLPTPFPSDVSINQSSELKRSAVQAPNLPSHSKPTEPFSRSEFESPVNAIPAALEPSSPAKPLPVVIQASAPPRTPPTQRRIERVEALIVRLPCRRNWSMPGGMLFREGKTTNRMFIKVITGDGECVGWGEAHASPLVNGEFFEGGVAAIKRYLRPAIEGLRLGEWDSLIRKMHRVVVSTSAGSVFKSALEAACWDAWAKVLEVPLCQLWSGKPPSKARLAYSLVGETSQAIAASFALGKEAGYTHFHIHLGARIELDDAILEALLGLKIKPERLLITLDQSRTLTQTRAVLRRIQPSGMHVAVPSELKHTEWSDELCHLLKPMLAGPYETLRRWDGGTVPVISLQWESAIGTALGIQLAMAMGQDSIIINHGLTHVDSPYVAKESLAVENGMVSIGPDNGLGLGVSDDAVRSLATEIF